MEIQDVQDNLYDVEIKFWELFSHIKSPQSVLQILSSTTSVICPSENYREEHVSFIKFFALIQYVSNKFPKGPVGGILEEILWKILILYPENGSHYFRPHHKNISCEMCFWLDNRLSYHRACPNPYLRLELFRLVRILMSLNNDKSSFDWDFAMDTFVYTICEINPYHSYATGEDKVMFGIKDFEYFIKKLKKYSLTPLFDNNLDRDTYRTQFFPHSLQLLGLYVSMATTKPELELCCRILVSLKPIISRPQYYSYVSETICDLTAGIFKLCGSDMKDTVWLLQNRDLTCIQLCFVGTKRPSELPGLLLSRQIQGPKAVRQHGLLLQGLTYDYIKKYDSSDSDSSDDESDVSCSSSSSD